MIYPDIGSHVVSASCSHHKPKLVATAITILFWAVLIAGSIFSPASFAKNDKALDPATGTGTTIIDEQNTEEETSKGKAKEKDKESDVEPVTGTGTGTTVIDDEVPTDPATGTGTTILEPATGTGTTVIDEVPDAATGTGTTVLESGRKRANTNEAAFRRGPKIINEAIEYLDFTGSDKVGQNSRPTDTTILSLSFPTATTSFTDNQILPATSEEAMSGYIHTVNKGNGGGFQTQFDIFDLQAYGTKQGADLVDGLIPTEQGIGTLLVAAESSLSAVGIGWVDQVQNSQPEIIPEKISPERGRPRPRTMDPAPDGIADYPNRGCLLQLVSFQENMLTLFSQNQEICLPESSTVEAVEGKFYFPELGLVLDNTINPIQSDYQASLVIAVIPVEKIQYTRYEASLSDGAGIEGENLTAADEQSVVRVANTNRGRIYGTGFPKGKGKGQTSQRFEFRIQLDRLTRSLTFTNDYVLAAKAL